MGEAYSGPFDTASYADTDAETQREVDEKQQLAHEHPLVEEEKRDYRYALQP